jgi:hypothetical protein
MPTAAFLVVALLGPAASLSDTAATSADLLLVDDDGGAAGEELGFFDEYFPLSLADNLDPATDDLILPFWLSAIFLPFGWLWAPYVFGDVQPGNDYLLDALLIAIFHALASACLLPIAMIPIIGWLLFIPIMIFNVINGWYLMPVAWLNAYDRSIKAKGATAGPKAGPDKSKRRRRPRQDASLPPSLRTVSMAY